MVCFMPNCRWGYPLAFLIMSTGCTQVERPQLPNMLPSHWQQPPVVAAVEVPATDLRGWWRCFHDPVLDQLVSHAIAQNLSLAQARLRLESVRTLTQHAKDSYLPQLSMSTRSYEQVSAKDTYFQLSLDAIWDLGLFGEREANQRQAEAKVRAAEADEQAARVAVVSEVVRHYLELRAAQHQIKTLEALVALNQRAQELLNIRITDHLDSADQQLKLQVRQAETMARLSAPRQVKARAEHALAALMGQTAPDARWATLQGQPMLQVGALQQVPSDLLRTRPDIWHAEAEVLEKSGELGVARAHLYPRVVLGVSYVYAYNLTQRNNNNLRGVPVYGPMIDIPLFDWGQRQATAQAQQQALDAAMEGYRQSLVEGLAQTEAALAVLNQEQARIQYLKQAVQAQEVQAQHGQTLSELGLASEWDLLGARREQLHTALQVSSAQAAYNLAFVALYKALGGAPLPAEVAQESQS